MIFVIDRRASTLRYRSGCLRLERKGLKTQEIPVRVLEQVIVYGNPLVETAAWRALAGAGVPVVMLAAKGKQSTAMLGSGLATQLPLRKMQHRLAGDPGLQTALAKWFVGLKMQSYDLPLRTLESRYHADVRDCKDFRSTRNRSQFKLFSAMTIPRIMGLEGQLAHCWYALLARHLPYCWKFAGRNRRPPRDPVNGLLSLGYTLLLSEVRQGLLASGFDPALGFLHQDLSGRESLALDFSEIFRAGVDDFVLQWLDDTDLDRDSFYFHKKTGCRMAKRTRPLFFKSWARQREHWPRATGLMDQEAPNTVAAVAPLKEQINGQVARCRAYMKSLEEQNGNLDSGPGHVPGDVEPELA